MVLASVLPAILGGCLRGSFVAATLATLGRFDVEAITSFCESVALRFGVMMVVGFGNLVFR